MDFFHSMAGMVHIELVSAALDQTVGILNAKGITLFDYQQEDLLTGRFWILQQDWRNVQEICARYEATAKILRKKGIFWSVRSILSRPILLTGVAAVFLFYLYIPSRIFFVQTIGNSLVPTRLILSEAENCGIGFGVSREAVRSEKVKNALLERIPQLQWVGVNTAGCVATISVTERNTDQSAEDKNEVSSLYASRDGYIISATTTKGSLVVQPGNTVKKRQLLISGLTDCGITIRAERAEGEILAQTNRYLNIKMLRDRTLIRTSGLNRKKISILFGKKRINLWKDSGISVDSCGRMYEEYYITLPGGFSLPIGICIESYTQYIAVSDKITPDYCQVLLSDTAQRYLKQQMVGGTILNADEKLVPQNDTIMLSGQYVCQEVISRVRLKEIGEINGEND